MTIKIQELHDSLKKQYDVLLFLDLAEIYNGKHSTIFHLLRKIKKETFKDNQRIVFYSSENITQDLTNHLAFALDKIDIPTFFVIVVSKYNILPQLIKSKEFSKSNDDNIIKNLIIDLEQTKKFLEKKFYNTDSICPLMFSSALYNQSDNSIRPCCRFAGDLGIVDNNNSIQDVLNNNFSNSIREQMKQGKKPAECSYCWNLEKYNLTSPRILSFLTLEDNLHNKYLDNNITKVEDLEITLNNLCNFKCRICSYKLSSQILSEEILYEKNKERISELKNMEYSSQTRADQAFEKLIDVADGLKSLLIIGGETLMNPTFYKIIDYLVDKDYAKNISLTVSTNGSQFAKNIEKFFQFRKVNLNLSIDDTEDRFEIQRGGSWPKILENILKFKSIQSKKLAVHLTPTVSIQNVLYLDQFVEFAESVDLPILWNYLEKPSYYCIDNINFRTQQEIIKKYSNHENQELRNIAKRISKITPKHNQEFLDISKKFDLRRKQNFSESHKEIIELMSRQ